MEYSYDWVFALAVVYTVVFNILLLPGYFMAGTALRHLRVICFRSLGKEFIASVLANTLLSHILNMVAIWHLALVSDEARVIEVNGILTGLRIALSGLLFCLVTSRQFMLSKIFGTLNNSLGRFQAFWPPLIVALVFWVPVLIFFYVTLFLNLDISIFAALLFTFYFAYTAAFAYFLVINRKISKIFSDYYANIAAGVCIIVILCISLWVTFQYQVVVENTYVFEAAITFCFAGQVAIGLLCTIVPPFIMWKTNPEKVKSWEEFNRKNAMIYGSSGGSRKTDNGLETVPEMFVNSPSMEPSITLDDVDSSHGLDSGDQKA